MSAPANTPPSAAAAPPSGRGGSRALVVVFLASLLAPGLDLAFGLDPYPSPVRNPETFPKLHLDRSLIHAPGLILYYVKESMGFRGALVHARAWFAWNLLGISSAPESVVRADPWMFLRQDRVIEDFRRSDPFSYAELERWRVVLEARAAWLAARGSRFLLVLAPNKETVYAEDMPAWFTREPGPSRLEQLRAHLAKTSPLEVLDLTDTLVAHKRDGRLYHYTDTHWNDLGAFLAYRALAARLEPWFPGLHPLEDRDLVHETRVTPGGDLARICGLKNELLEPQNQVRLASTSAPATYPDGSPVTYDRMDPFGRPRFDTRDATGEIPSATIVRDSFGEALVPFLSHHVKEAIWLWRYDFPLDVIEQQHPSLVIQEIAERKLMVLTPENPPAVAAPSR
jgi:alginate O-acetyltransferase complex protein AlgJ